MSLVMVAEPLPLTTDDHDVVRVGNTRVTLDTVVYAFQDGATAEEIVHQYPSLHLADVYGVVAYYLRHKMEIDVYLERREQQAIELRALHEARYNSVGIRERLLARRNKE